MAREKGPVPVVGTGPFSLLRLLAKFADQYFETEKQDDENNHVVPEQNPKDNHFNATLRIEHLAAQECTEQDSRDDHCENRDKQVLIPCAQNKRQPASASDHKNTDGEIEGLRHLHLSRLCLNLVHSISLLIGWLASLLPDVFILIELRIKNKVQILGNETRAILGDDENRALGKDFLIVPCLAAF
jgi:hypothetical protein